MASLDWLILLTMLKLLAVKLPGRNDEYMISGSDDINLSVWQKSTDKLHDILEGDTVSSIPVTHCCRWNQYNFQGIA